MRPTTQYLLSILGLAFAWGPGSASGQVAQLRGLQYIEGGSSSDFPKYRQRALIYRGAGPPGAFRFGALRI